MKRNINLKSLGMCLLACTALLVCNACNNEDDVMEIFTDKTWKLTRLTTEGNRAQFYDGLWSNDEEEENSYTALREEGNFTLLFNLAEDNNGGVFGTIEAHGIRASINNATVRIDGKEHTLSIDGRISGTENDKLGKAFLNGLLNVYKYEGDANSMTLYFNEGNTTKIMGFKAQ